MTKILSDSALDVLSSHNDTTGLSKTNGRSLIDNVRRLKQALAIAMAARINGHSVLTEGELDRIRELVGDE